MDKKLWKNRPTIEVFSDFSSEVGEGHLKKIHFAAFRWENEVLDEDSSAYVFQDQKMIHRQ